MNDKVDIESKISFLNSILEKGIVKLLDEAKEKNYLDPPFGRKADPTPLITETDYIKKLKDINIEASEAHVPDFSFEYGFDPLKFLSDYLKWAHPDSVLQRKKQKEDSHKYLMKRVSHARNQLKTFHNLKSLAAKQKSGVLWGPFVSPTLTFQKEAYYICIFKPLLAGEVQLQISDREDFSRSTKEIIQRLEEEPPVEPTEDEAAAIAETRSSKREIDPLKIKIHDLIPDTEYFIRVRVVPLDLVQRFEDREQENELVEPEHDMHSESVHSSTQNNNSSVSPVFSEELFLDVPFIESKFVSLPSDQISPPSPSNSNTDASSIVTADKPSFPEVRVMFFGLETHSVSRPLLEERTHLSCLLGDLIPPSSDDSATATSANTSSLVHQSLGQEIETLYTQDPLFASEKSMFRRSLFLFSWLNRLSGSATALQKEEERFFRWKHDLKKFQKKQSSKSSGSSGRRSSSSTKLIPPAFYRSDADTALSTAVKFLPFELDEGMLLDSSTSPLSSTASHADIESFKDSLKGCQMLYHSFWLGADIQVFVLDLRGSDAENAGTGDYLGREQAHWLEDGIEKSVALWKILICGKSFGILRQTTEATDTLPPLGEPSLAAENIDSDSLLAHSQDEGDDKKEANDGTAGINTSSRQVQVQEPEKETKRTIDELGRAKYTLQHTLANLQYSINRNEVDIDEDCDGSCANIGLNSGLIVFSNGHHRIRSGQEDRALENPPLEATKDKVRDDSLPSFLSLYYNLQSRQFKSSNGESDPSPANVQGPLRGKNSSTLTTGSSNAFMAEVCLGSIFVKNSDLRYYDGIDAEFLDLSDAFQLNYTGAHAENCSPYIDLKLTPKGALMTEIKFFDSSSQLSNSILKCVFHTSLQEASSDEEFGESVE